MILQIHRIIVNHTNLKCLDKLFNQRYKRTSNNKFKEVAAWDSSSNNQLQEEVLINQILVNNLREILVLLQYKINKEVQVFLHKDRIVQIHINQLVLVQVRVHSHLSLQAPLHLLLAHHKVPVNTAEVYNKEKEKDTKHQHQHQLQLQKFKPIKADNPMKKNKLYKKS